MAEVGATALLYLSFFLPWFQVDRPATPTTPAHVEMVAWVTHASLDYALDSWDLLIPIAARLAAGFAIAGLVLPGRGKVLGVLFGSAMAVVAVFLQLTTVNAGQEVDGTAAVTGVGIGIWIYAVAAVLGVGLAVLDLALTGYSTFVSRTVGVPSIKGYVAFAAMSVAGALAVAQVIPAFWVALGIVLVGLILAAPTRTTKIAAALLAMSLLIAIEPAFRTPANVVLCLLMLAIVGSVAGIRLWRDRDLPEAEG